MTESSYNKYNNIVGWVVFAIAAFTYLSTMEPTASLWDCGEFVSASYKLEVVHPPGAPFFLMLNRFFTIFAPNPQWVPKLVNASSGIASAFAILFLFWTITALARKMVIKDLKNISASQLIAVLGSGAVGALAFTFSSSFWFSAVEGEVYALSAFFMAIVFWLMMKWEKRADSKYNLRWLVLIAYLIGLSIGVHLLSLLVIPALAFVYYFRKFDFSWKGVVVAALIGGAILFFYNSVVIQWIPEIASKFELLFVNNLGLPFWSGIFFFLLLMAAGIIYGIYWSQKNHKVVLNMILVCMSTILIAYSSYTMVVIRSTANPTIDMNNPETVFNLISYLTREQYGDRPILYGPQFTANIIDIKEGGMDYMKKGDKYIEVGRKKIPIYDPDDMSLFPRMADNTRNDRVEAYREWEDLRKGEKPTFGENIDFFIRYQLGQMYWRYFAWNFIGRQNEEQGFGPDDFNAGNWMSGIPFLDKILTRVGPQKNLPYEMKWDKARNHLYFLPFIFGILGLLFQFKRDKSSAIYIIIFFILTGFALIVYSNQPPLEPRERDYVLVGSFYAFSIWIGLGVLKLREWLIKYINNKTLVSIAVVVAGLILVPSLMAHEEWDDHDRSGRYMVRDLAVNYLESCPKNAILFTNGDNETYPLWYAQEVEGIRTDVRSVNLSLLNTDWYNETLRNPANGHPGISWTIPPEKLVQGTRDQIIFRKENNLKMDPNRFYNLREIINFITSDNPKTRLRMQDGSFMDYFPTKKFSVPINKKAVEESGLVKKDNFDHIPNELHINFNKNNMMKADLLVLDLVAKTDWKRPLCFSITSGRSSYMGLDPYFRQDGMVYTFVPVQRKSFDKQIGWVNTDIMYDNVMNKFKWGRIDKTELYVDNVMLRQLQNFRNVFNRLVKALAVEGKKDKAEEVLDRCMKVLPENNVPYGFLTYTLIESYYRIGAVDKAEKYAKRFRDIAVNDLDYYLRLDKSKMKQVEPDIQRYFYVLQNFQNFANKNGQKDFAAEVKKDYDRLEKMYYASSKP